MRTLLLILLLVNLAVVSGWAKTYSCRDSSGRMHYSDNLQGLPEECLGKEKEFKPGPADNMQYVPALPQPQGSGDEFLQSVRAVELELQEKEEQKQKVQELRGRAGVLVDSYRQAGLDKRKARRSWSNSSRQIFKDADEDLAEAREGKQQLLKELGEVKGLAKEKAAIREMLAGIEME